MMPKEVTLAEPKHMMLFAISIIGHQCKITLITIYGPAKGANM
jgi:hypothetical protein